MGKPQISDQVGADALRSLSGSQPNTATAVRYVLQQLALLAPGGSVEVRVPPYGAVQCIAGLDHRRGTPPNLVELNADTLVQLALGITDWPTATAAGLVHVSGSRAGEVATLFPISKIRLD